MKNYKGPLSLAVAGAIWAACGAGTRPEPAAEELPFDAGVEFAEKIAININDIPRVAPEGNDTGRFRRALGALEDAGGGTLLLPANSTGSYILDSTLTYPGNKGQLMIRGDGRDLTFIIQEGADAGFIAFGCLGRLPDGGLQPDSGSDTICDGGEQNGRLLVRDLSLSCAASSYKCGTAIDARWPPMAWDIPVVDIEDVAIHGADGYHAWVNGIFLENPSGTRITDVSIKGDYENRTRPYQYADAGDDVFYPYIASDGLSMRGTNRQPQVSHYISSTNVSHYNTCYMMLDWLEGIAVNQFEAVECGNGVVFIGKKYSKDSKAINLYLVNGHINVRKNGVYVDGVSNVNLIGVDVYKDGALSGWFMDGGIAPPRSKRDEDAGVFWPRSDLATFVSGGWLSIDSSRFSTIQAAEKFWYADAGQDTAVVISNFYQANVTDNGFTGFNRGVDVYSSGMVLVQSNRFDRTNLPVALDNGTNRCFVTDNMWLAPVSPAGSFYLDTGTDNRFGTNQVWQ